MKMEDIEDVFLQVPDTDPNTGEEDPFAGETRYYSGVEKYFWNKDSERLGWRKSLEECKLCGFVIPDWIPSGHLEHITLNHLNEFTPIPKTRWKIGTMKKKDRAEMYNVNFWLSGAWKKHFEKDKCKFCGFVLRKRLLSQKEWEEMAVMHMDEKHKDSPYDKDGTTQAFFFMVDAREHHYNMESP